MKLTNERCHKLLFVDPTPCGHAQQVGRDRGRGGGRAEPDAGDRGEREAPAQVTAVGQPRPAGAEERGQDRPGLQPQIL